MASVFYEELWRTLSPGEALLRARKCASNELERDETWAIVRQNASSGAVTGGAITRPQWVNLRPSLPQIIFI